jgi:hypothetical protein
MSKGSKRRRENTALVEANWEVAFGKAKDTEANATEATAKATSTATECGQSHRYGQEPTEATV